VKNHPKKVFSYSKENGGLGDARNFGLQFAHASYVGFVDSDDYVEEQMYEKMYLSAMKNNSDLVVCDIEYVWENSSQRKELKGFKKIEGVEERKSVFLSPLFAWNKLYRKDLFIKYNLEYPKRLWYEDIPVTIPLFAFANTISYVEEVLIHYVQRDSSIMASKNTAKMHDIFEVLKQVYRFYQNHQLLDTYYAEIEYLFVEQLMLYGSFRFYRSESMYKLMNEALKVMKEYFPNWRKNHYIKTLHKHYQFYLKTVNIVTMIFYQAFVLIKGTRG
ncbi:MAG: glycosyltransferase, partial [Ignavibacteria bacterium]|nr:glycosyltransferase [Ignavibacteria bacterium]